MKDKSRAKNNLLVFGNPKLADPKFDLPFAEREAAQIAGRREGSKLLVREKATETAVKRFSSAFRWLHFASHGIFDADNPMASRLLLASDAGNDGDLTVSEIYDLQLDADLVTLSACETALGEIANASRAGQLD